MRYIRLSCLWAAVLALLAGVMSGCAAQASVTEAEAGPNAIRVTDFGGRKLAFKEAPQQIVALGNGEVDIVYALGASVVGRPVGTPGLPEAAESAAIVGNAHTVDLEKIALLRPDVVLGNYPLNANDVPLLNGIGVEAVLTSANSIADIRKQITLLGQLLDREARAAELVSTLDQRLAELGGQPKSGARCLIVYGAPGTYLAALPNSLAGNLLEQAGGTNIAASFPSLQNFPHYAQLNTERVVEANPQAILIITHGSTEEVEKGFVKEMEQNPAWNSIDAVKNDKIMVLPPDLFGTNPGTRTAEAVAWLMEHLAP